MQPLLRQDPEGAGQDQREGRVRHRRHRVRRERQPGDRDGALRPGQARRQALQQSLQDHQGDRDRRAAAAAAAAAAERGAAAPAAEARGEAPAARAGGDSAGARARARARAGTGTGAGAAEERSAQAPAAGARGETCPAADQDRGAVPVALPLPAVVAVRLLLPPRPRRLPLLLLRQEGVPCAGPRSAASVHHAAVPAAVPLRRLQDRLRGGPLVRLRHYVIHLDRLVRTLLVTTITLYKHRTDIRTYIYHILYKLYAHINVLR